MKPVSVETIVNAPADKVFTAFTDFHNAAERISGIKSLTVLTEGPIAVGTKFRETRIMMGREATEEMEITTFEPGRRYTVEADSCGCHYHTEFTFDEVDGVTTVRCQFTGKPVTMFAKVMMVLMKPMQNKLAGMCCSAIQGDMNDLRAVVESTTD